jgi:hypothetical protein
MTVDGRSGGLGRTTSKRRLWALPWTLLGLLLSAFWPRRRMHGPVRICEGATWPRRLGWRYRAITFGHVILVVGDLDEETLAHELVHVRQYERWGPFFIPVYLVASALAAGSGDHPYRDNRFEVEARDPSIQARAAIATKDGPPGAD